MSPEWHSHNYRYHYSLAAQLPSSALSQQRKTRLLASSLQRTLDRVNVLGSDTNGHTGCVNALSWAQDGELLISSGDDKTVRLWRMDASQLDMEYPFVCNTVIHTGHRANIFNACMLPYSTRIATVSGDRQVRISDIGSAIDRVDGIETEYASGQADIRVLQCHTDRVKRIVTEESPDLFLTVAEDGTVRQHDLRTTHSCRSGGCPQPLVRLNHDLSTLALSPLTPYQFVTAGESPYGYLFDRRCIGRYVKEEWGMLPDDNDLTTCVRRFGRKTRSPAKREGSEHVTGARMASNNGHEVLLSYSSDAVYLFSTRDEAFEPSKLSAVLKQNSTASPVEPVNSTNITDTEMTDQDIDLAELNDDERSPLLGFGTPRYFQNEGAEEEEVEGDTAAHIPFVSTPVVFPKARYEGACNVETVKDVNFLGPHDEYVTSGSDDGNFFIWNKSTGKLCDILEGDGSVVNVIEGHPHLPLVAVSGIDTTVKLFAPSPSGWPRPFSKFANCDDIVARNADASSRRLHNITGLYVRHLLSRAATSEAQQCVNQ